MELAPLAILSPATHEAIIAHYERVGPLLEASFGGVPVVATFFPHWPDPSETFEAGLQTIPSTLNGVPVRNAHGTLENYLALSTNALLWQVHRGAIEFSSWTPLASDPESAAFARLIVRPTDPAKPEIVKFAVLALRSLLATKGLAGALVADGYGGFTVFVPLGDAPLYAPLRESLHCLTDAAAREHPDLITTEPANNRPIGPARVSVSTNARGHFSVLPYSVRGNASLSVATPLRWSELGGFESGKFTVHEFADRLTTVGDVFASETAMLQTQHSDSLFA